MQSGNPVDSEDEGANSDQIGTVSRLDEACTQIRIASEKAGIDTEADLQKAVDLLESVQRRLSDSDGGGGRCYNGP